MFVRQLFSSTTLAGCFVRQQNKVMASTCDLALVVRKVTGHVAKSLGCTAYVQLCGGARAGPCRPASEKAWVLVHKTRLFQGRRIKARQNMPTTISEINFFELLAPSARSR